MKKHSLKERIVAVMMAALLAVAVLVPTGTLTNIAKASGTGYTITVTDSSTSEAIEGAIVTYTVYESNAAVTGMEDVSAQTDASGEVTIDLSDLSTAITNGTVTLSYEVTASGYNSAADSSIAVDSATGTTDVQLTAGSGTHSITVYYTGGGSVKVGDTSVTSSGESVSVNDGSAVTLTITPTVDETYISSLEVGGTAVTVSDTDKYDEYQYAIGSVTADVTVNVTFQAYYMVTFSAVTNGTLSDTTENVDAGSSPSITFTPDEGYTVDTVMIGGASSDSYELVAGSDNTYQVTAAINTATTISVTFKVMNTVNSTGVVDYSGYLSQFVAASYTTYVFKDAATFAVSDLYKASYAGIRIVGTDSEGDSQTYANTGGPSVDVTESLNVTGIYLLSGKTWMDATDIMDATKIHVVIDETAPSGTMTLSDPATAGDGTVDGYYNGDVTVTVSATDDETDENEIGIYSGISSIEYAIMDGDDTPTAWTTLYSAAANGVESISNQTFTVSSAIHNSANVNIYLRVTDCAGNTSTTVKTVSINTEEPEIDVSVDGTIASGAIDGYYNASRTATITIMDRSDTFDETDATEGISITATNAEGEAVDVSSLTSGLSWTPDNAQNPTSYSAEIVFNVDANYEWSISYTNKAGKTAEQSAAVAGATETDYEFTVDTAAPTISGSAEIGLGSALWKEITEQQTAASTVFDLWTNTAPSIEVLGTDITDATSGVYSVYYYTTDSTTSLTKDNLLSEDFTLTSVTVDENSKETVYAKITDYAGNSLYIGTDGVIYDTTESSITLTPDAANTNGYYT
ncbi:MAG: hypothetical protein LUC32_04270, partial [Clostridiales bacterium]|nr:hypothetical protein [Clostridiales bacterium]